MTSVLTGHIALDVRGIAMIEGSRIKVMHLVLAKQSYGWSPEEMCRQFPHLSLAQIHAALTYYYDNQAEIDAQIVADREKCKELSKTTGPQPFKRGA